MLHCSAFLNSYICLIAGQSLCELSLCSLLFTFAVVSMFTVDVVNIHLKTKKIHPFVECLPQGPGKDCDGHN